MNSYQARAAYSADGERILSYGADHGAAVWDTTGRRLFAVPSQPVRVIGAAFGATGRRLLVAHEDTTVKVFDADGHEVGKLAGDQGTWYGDYEAHLPIAVSPVSDRVATVAWTWYGWRGYASYYLGTMLGSSPTTLWDFQGTRLTTLYGNESLVWSVAMSPKGDHILTSSADGTTRVWTSEGVRVAADAGHNGSVWRAVFSPTGDVVASYGDDRIVRLWRPEREDLIEAANRAIRRDFTSSELWRYYDLLERWPLKGQ